MTINFSRDPCTNPDDYYHDNNLFKRAVLDLLCQIVPSTQTFLGNVQLTDSLNNPVAITAGALNVAIKDATGVPYSTSNPMPITGSVNATVVATISAAPGMATSYLQGVGNNFLAAIDASLVLCNTSNIMGVVSVNNAGAGAAVNIQDGGNSITVDGSIDLNAGSNLIGKVNISGEGLTPDVPINASVGDTTSTVLAANANRKGLVLTNTSTEPIFIGLGVAAEVDKGIVLTTVGSVWVMDSFTFTTGDINAIVVTGTSNLAIQEYN